MPVLQTPLTVATTVTANATLAAGKHTPADATAGPITLTLPTPATVGARLRVEKTDATANAVTVSGTIRGGASTVSLSSQYEALEFSAESLTSWRPTTGHRTKASLDARYVSLAGTTPGAVPVIKPSGDGRAGVWEYTHNDATGYLFHLLAGTSMSHTAALIALGVDNDGIGLLAANKVNGRGIVGDQRATVTDAAGYWLHATQRSTAAPLVRLEQQTDGGADTLQLLSFGTQTSGNLLYVGDPSGQAGVISAVDGSIDWRRIVTIRDKSGAVPSYLDVTADSGFAANIRPHTLVRKDGIEFYSSTGSAGTWWPYKIIAGGSNLHIQAGGSTSAVGTPGTLTSVITVKNAQLGFFGVTPVAKRATTADASDLTTAIALVNALKADLVALGLKS